MIDKGHRALVHDLTALLNKAEAKQFHDYENEEYSTPKIELVKQLQGIIDAVKSGAYDNIE